MAPATKKREVSTNTNLTIGMNTEERDLLQQAAEIAGYTHRSTNYASNRKAYGVGTWARAVLVAAANDLIQDHQKKKGKDG